MSTPRVRRSLTDLQYDYEHGKPEELTNLMRAWKGIKELEATDPNSFFVLGGYHGEPFRGAGWGSSAYWGGYCQHGNVLFPVWHRIYLYELEQALRSIKGCEDVTMPFWDECSLDSRTNGIPWALTDEFFQLDGEPIPNPLQSFRFPRTITDHISGDVPNYTKPVDYVTVRYPYSGLVGTPEDAKASEEHNKKWPYPEGVKHLNDNVLDWLNHTMTFDGKVVSTGVYKAFVDCLDAPNYTVFSNTSSAAEWNDNEPHEVPVESPHNKIHLAIGGFDVPKQPNFSKIRGANGDMGENDTAGLDPIFFFHHCYIDRVFWLWQKKHNATGDLPVIAGYPGTNSVDSQGPTPGVAPNSWLSMDTPLEPFTLTENGKQRSYIGRDAFDAEGQLGYTYGPGSLTSTLESDAALSAPADGPKLRVAGIDRASIRGSFVIAAYADIGGEKTLIGTEAVLSRWHVEGCANCQTHLAVSASFPLHGLDPVALGGDGLHVAVRTRDGLLGDRAHSLTNAIGAGEPRPFRVEVR